MTSSTGAGTGRFPSPPPPAAAARRLARLARFVARFSATTLAEVERDRDPFRLLVACVISLRTKDAVTAAASARLFAEADRPAALAALPESRIAALIYPAGFYRTKARQLREIARLLTSRHGGAVPRSREELVALPGVGRKTANLVLGLGHRVPAICVDTHVHRIPNRWGWVRTRTPEESERALEAILPRRWWIPVNDLLVTFGQNVCTPLYPDCDRCPLSGECPRLGVARSRAAGGKRGLSAAAPGGGAGPPTAPDRASGRPSGPTRRGRTR